jgi:hypothetical protein
VLFEERHRFARHSRSKTGVASLAYVPAIYVFGLTRSQDVDARHEAGHDEPECSEIGTLIATPSRHL